MGQEMGQGILERAWYELAASCGGLVIGRIDEALTEPCPGHPGANGSCDEVLLGLLASEYGRIDGGARIEGVVAPLLAHLANPGLVRDPLETPAVALRCRDLRHLLEHQRDEATRDGVPLTPLGTVAAMVASRLTEPLEGLMAHLPMPDASEAARCPARTAMDLVGSEVAGAWLSLRSGAAFWGSRMRYEEFCGTTGVPVIDEHSPMIDRISIAEAVTLMHVLEVLVAVGSEDDSDSWEFLARGPDSLALRYLLSEDGAEDGAYK